MNTQLSAAKYLNKHAICTTATPESLEASFGQWSDTPDIYHMINRQSPHLFSSTPFFISKDEFEQIQSVIKSIESVISTKSYQDFVLAQSHDTAKFNPLNDGVFFGYDFHLSEDGPKLIEINSNAGGALLNTTLMRANHPCCEEVEPLFSNFTLWRNTPETEKLFVKMFYQEWQKSNFDKPLKTIAIIDENPEKQGLYPEFLLFKSLFEKHGIKAVITAPEALKHKSDGLYLGDSLRIDLIYNRLTDFYLQADHLKPIKNAYLKRDIVLTPNPRSHALWANKANMTLFSDPDILASLGIDPQTLKTVVAAVPETFKVSAQHADQLWAVRKKYFFKPVDGHGSKAAYKGSKLTKKTWAYIVESNQYIAQKLIDPGKRLVSYQGKDIHLKSDIRAYTYEGKIQLMAARLYRGQTTNMRTPGGGFAPVLMTG